MNDFTPDTVPLKHCFGCKKYKPATPGYFHRKKATRDGLHGTCKQCRAEKEGFGYQEPLAEGLKRCTKCKEEKLATTEYFHPSKRDGLQYWCKVCQSAHAKEYNAANAKSIAARKRRYNQANVERARAQVRANRAANQERHIAWSRAYYIANKERYEERRRVYYAAHKEHYAEYHRVYNVVNKARVKERGERWRAANKPIMKAAKGRRRAREANAEGMHTAADVKRQYKAQKGKCYYCHEKVGDNYHVDHVVPLARGGSNGPENLVISCPHCNSSKSGRLPHEWPQGNRLL